MSPGAVVPVKPVCKVFVKPDSLFVRLKTGSLIFQGEPESFDENVFLEPSFADQADLDVPGLTEVNVSLVNWHP